MTVISSPVPSTLRRRPWMVGAALVATAGVAWGTFTLGDDGSTSSTSAPTASVHDTALTVAEEVALIRQNTAAITATTLTVAEEVALIGQNTPAITATTLTVAEEVALINSPQTAAQIVAGECLTETPC